MTSSDHFNDEPSRSLNPRQCWSWAHRHGTSRVPARHGLYTCALHDNEELAIRSTIRELESVASGLKKLADLPGAQRKGEASKAMLQSPLRSFFEEHLSRTFRAGTGLEQGDDEASQFRERDIIIDWRENSRWHGDARILGEGPPPLAHLEVAFVPDPDLSKLLTDLDRLNRSIARSVEHDRAATKTWTAVVLCGPGWKREELAVGRAIHRAHCTDRPKPREGVNPQPVRASLGVGGPSRDLELVPRGAARCHQWWPAVDLVVTPYFFWKKTEVFETRGTGARLAWGLYPLAPDERDLDLLMPLATARGFLHHYLALASSGTLHVEAAARPGPQSSWCGPPLHLPDFPRAKDSGRRVLAVASRHDEPPTAFWPTDSRCLAVTREDKVDEHSTCTKWWTADDDEAPAEERGSPFPRRP